MKLRFLIALAIAGALSMGAAPGTTPSTVGLLVQKARSLEARDRADLAAQVWQQVLIADPKQPDALAGLARWAKRSGRVSEANAYIDKLRAVDPSSSALTEVNSGSANSPHTDRLAEAAKLAADQRYEEAMAIYRELFGDNPPAGGWSLAYYETEAQTPQGFEPAVAALKKLAREHPDLPEYQIAAGRLLTYRRPTRESGIALLAGVGGTGPAAAKAKEAWRQALLWEKNNRAYMPAIQAYVERYHDAELEAVLGHLKAEPAPSGDAIPLSKDEQVGYRALKQNSVVQAEQSFAAALKETPHSAGAHAGMGFVRMKQGDFAAAADEFRAAQAQRPKNADLAQALETAKFWQAMQAATEAVKKEQFTQAISAYEAALSIRSTNTDALRGLAGVYLQAGQTENAAKTYEHLIRLQPQNPEFREALVRSKLGTGNAASALESLTKIPPSVLAQLTLQRSFRILQASVYADAGREKEAAELFGELERVKEGEASPSEQIQLANLMVRFHHANQAAESMQHLTSHDPENAAAWEMLVSALAAAGDVDAAEKSIEQMPETVRRAAMSHTGFLETVAGLEEAAGRPQEAKAFLQRILAMPQGAISADKKAALEIRIAPLLAKTGQAQEAESRVRAVLETHPEDESAWKSYLLILNDEHRDRDVLAAAGRMPQEVSRQLRKDGDVVAVLARAESAAGNPETGIRLLETYMADARVDQGSTLAAMQIQLCWLLLDAPGKQPQLYRELEQIRSRTDLDAGQRENLADIWVTWILRSAEKAGNQGNLVRSIALLREGVSLYPSNVRLQKALAGYLLKSGDAKRALNLYTNWGLTGAGPDDYAGAIGAALTERNFQYADTWLEKGLGQWPRNAQLLTLAGERARAKGDFKGAEMYWREALAAKQSEPTITSPAGQPKQAGSLLTLLMGTQAAQVAGYEATSSDTRVHLSSMQTERVVPSSDLDALAPLPSEAPLHSRVDSPAALAGQNLVEPQDSGSPTQSLEDKLASIEGRNSPFMQSQMSVQGRSGQAGFDRLLIEQADFEASSTIANTVRVSVDVKPTYLDGGTASGNSTLGFGRSPVGSTFGPQTASGIAADAQLSTQSLGLHFGSSPQGFLTHEIIGGLRFQPANGPITFLIERDNVKDTMLSYAGARDPVTNQVWGGVVANSATVLGHWGDDKSGLYASLGYESLTGTGVESNRAINGNFGTYWKIYSRKEGSLTLGTNFSAMHYDKNLRFFTTGQGGYFSPQQYFLFGVPFRWTGIYNNRLQYVISGSLGTQHFEEDESPYFPLDGKPEAGKMYPTETSTGANFSFDARLNYQLAPHWFVGAWANANNARDYTASSAGLFVKYTFQPKPLGFENQIAAVPDWRGQQPFSLF